MDADQKSCRTLHMDCSIFYYVVPETDFNTGPEHASSAG